MLSSIVLGFLAVFYLINAILLKQFFKGFCAPPARLTKAVAGAAGTKYYLPANFIIVNQWI